MKLQSPKTCLAAAVLIPALQTAVAHASPFATILESNTPTGSGQDAFLLGFPTLIDFASNTNLSVQQSAIPINQDFSFAGFTATSLPGTVEPVSSPASSLLLATGLVGLLFARRRWTQLQSVLPA